MKIIFFGTPPFAAHILSYLYDQEVDIVAVVTRPDRPKGRGRKASPSAVKKMSLKKNPEVPVLQPEKASSPEFVDELNAMHPDLFIVAAYGEIMKANLLAVPKKTCINVHPSILPKYRGATPIQRAIMNGDQETGVTIMEMILKMDAGDIYKIVKTPLPVEMTFGELEGKLCELAEPALLQVVHDIKKGTAEKTPQDDAKATYVSKISLEDRQINWSKSAMATHNQIRALSPQPGAFCFVDIGGEKKRLSIKRSEVAASKKGSPGQTLVYENNEWVVGCGDGALALLEVQLEGKKTLLIGDFIRGMPVPPKLSFHSDC